MAVIFKRKKLRAFFNFVILHAKLTEIVETEVARLFFKLVKFSVFDLRRFLVAHGTNRDLPFDTLNYGSGASLKFITKYSF